MKLFESYKEEEVAEKPKSKRHTGTITIENRNYSESIGDDRGGKPYFSVDFEGHNEGQCCGFETEEEVENQVEYLKDLYSKEYHIVIKDERGNDRFKPLLAKWKEFILNLCKNHEYKEEDIEIWFDESAPYDVAINLRLKSHRCYWNCVSFRFEKNKLQAYDSHFGNGTSFVDKSEDESKIITEVMERVFNKECSDSSWNNDSIPKPHKIDDKGWIVRD